MDALPVRLDDLIAAVVERHPAGQPLDRLADAAETAALLGELADHLIGHFVDEARRSGATWTEIGQRMGVTKQAVQRRFVTRAFGDTSSPDVDRFARFTPRARRVVISAQQHARSEQHQQVTPDHVLLGLLDEREALAARAIAAQGIALDDLAAVVAVGTHQHATTSAPLDHIPFAPSAKQLLERCFREALRMGHNYIGTEHMLLAMLRDTEAPAGRVLVNAGVDADAAERWIIDHLIDPSAP